MNIRVDTPRLSLCHAQMMQLDHAAGVRIDCLEGSLWITQDHDPQDHVLRAGEAIAFARDHPVLVYALEPARLDLLAAHARRPQACP